MLNENNALNIAFVLSIKVTFIFLITTQSLYLNIIYKWPTLIAVYYINFLVTVFNLYLIPALYPVSTTYKDEVIINIL